jgi:uncharacterized protein (DUF427 family)
VRYYIPKLDVRFQLLTPSKTQSTCAYKGITSEYWQMETAPGEVKDVAWCYRAPTLESSKIANLVCFYNERVDAIYVDGEPIEKVETIWK